MLGSATDAELDVTLEDPRGHRRHEASIRVNFPKCYYKVHGKPLNFKDLGYNKLSDLIRRLPGVYVRRLARGSCPRRASWKRRRL